MERQPTVYILTNNKNTVLYIGVTSNLVNRIEQHKQKQVVGFTQRYHVDKLVHYEYFNTMIEAITREKQLKNWHREWKMNLIRANNTQWRDLTGDF